MATSNELSVIQALIDHYLVSPALKENGLRIQVIESLVPAYEGAPTTELFVTWGHYARTFVEHKDKPEVIELQVKELLLTLKEQLENMAELLGAN